MCVRVCLGVTNIATIAIRVAKRIWHIWDQYQSHETDSTLPQKYYIAQSKIKKMTIACKLWLLAVVCVAFLYQDGPQGNGVLCVKKAAPSDEDNSPEAGSSDEDAGHDSDRESGDSSSGGDSTVKDDDNSDHEEHSKHETNKKSGKGKNRHRDHDDDDGDDDDGHDNDDGEVGEEEKDEDDEESKDAGPDEDDDKEHHKDIKNKINHDDEIGEVQIFTTTTITGKPKDILKFLDAGI